MTRGLPEDPACDDGRNRDDVCRELSRTVPSHAPATPAVPEKFPHRDRCFERPRGCGPDRLGEPARGEQVDPWGAYSLSKFADVAFASGLARRLEGTGITANCPHPGVVDTKLSHAAAPGVSTIPPEEGARTSIYLATPRRFRGIGQVFG